MNGTHSLLTRGIRLGLAALALPAALLAGGVAPTLAQAVGAAGTVVAWGQYGFGETARPAGLNDVTAIATGGAHSLALKSDGTVVAWGDDTFGQATLPAGLSDVIAVSAGGIHSLALKSDGTVIPWGSDRFGLVTTALRSGVIAIAAGGQHSLALRSDGTVYAWGDTFNGQTTVPAGLNGVIAIAAGGVHSLALKGDGTVVAWGCGGFPGDNQGQCTVPAGLSGVTAIAAGGTHSLALKSDGTVVAWGDNRSGEITTPAGLNGVIAIAAGGFYSLALKSDGTVVAWGNNTTGQTAVPAGLNHVAAIAAGGGYSLAITTDAVAPSVSVDQAAGQADPTQASPLHFTLTFSEPVIGAFDPGDVIVSGTAGATTATVTGAAGSTTYDVAVTGMNANGTVVVSLAANAVTDVAGNGNAASTSTDNTVTFIFDNTGPVITYHVTGTPDQLPWFISDVNVTWSVTDGESAITSQTGCDATLINTDTAGTTLTCTATSAGGTTHTSVTISRDTTGPIVTVSGTHPNGAAYTPGTWTNQNVIVQFSCTDSLAGVWICPAGQTISPEGTWTAIGEATDEVGNRTSASFGPIQIDKTVPTIVGVAAPAPNAAGWFNSNVTVSFTCTDALSGVGTCSPDQTLSADGANQSVSGTANDIAGNSASTTVSGIHLDKTAPTLNPVVSPLTVVRGGAATVTSGAADALSGLASQTCGALDTGTVGVKTVTCTATDLAGNTASAAATYTVVAGFPTHGVLDSFNRGNGGVGGNWQGLTGTSFYKIASNRLDVQVGGALVWKPATLGTSQEAFVTLSTIDSRSPAQGLLLKVQTGTFPNAGAIAVVYDALAKAVRVSTLRLNDPTWTVYAGAPATFANGDQLGARALANGTVEIYKNGVLITTVTLNAADQAFFNGKGGKIGLWTVAAPNAVFDDFGGGPATP